MLPLNGWAKHAAVSNLAHTSYCPTQDWHRVFAETAANPVGYETELVGYFYMPHRSTDDQGDVVYNPPGNPDGKGWVEKKKFGGKFKYAPIMSDMIQGFPGGTYQWGGSGAPFPSHLDRNAKWTTMNPATGRPMPPVYGANYLFEDGSVTWYHRDAMGVGATVGSWECFYRIPL